VRCSFEEETVGVTEILLQIDREIAQLQRAKDLLSGNGNNKVAGNSIKPASAHPKRVRKKKRNLTPEGRKRIAEAVRRRWERQKKAAAPK
jgi:hypothetical protein